MVPEIRLQTFNDRPVNPGGDHVLYWMIANRRVDWNFSFDRAVDWSLKLKKPLLIFEALRCDYPWASDRFHRFILDGMLDNFGSLKNTGAFYYPYVETRKGQEKGLLRALAEKACVVITDDFPSFFLPKMVEAAAEQIDVRMEKADSNGLLPMRAVNKIFTRAFDFRKFLQKNLIWHLDKFPSEDPLKSHDLPQLKCLPKAIEEKWPPAALKGVQPGQLPINHSVQSVNIRGGATAAKKRLSRFVQERIQDYGEFRNEPEKECTSGLSPYLHFGHISSHQVFNEIINAQQWSVTQLSPVASGKRVGWWGMNQSAEAFLDQLITWRELGYNWCWQSPDYDQYSSLPKWALQTLSDHVDDKRAHIYSIKEFEKAETHDALWNAAQTQLVEEGFIHNYLRMLWGKKILEWNQTPEEALQIMIEINNKYALDGRNPNSYSGIFWVLGRYDRPWGPERPILGKVRYMTSENTARKFQVKNYITKYSKSN